MAERWPLKQTFLHTLIATLVVGALVGIYAFLFGDFGETEMKILATTLSISYFSVTSLACAAAWEKGRDRLLAPAGLMVGLLGFVVFIPGIWAEWYESQAFAKSMVILGIFAFSLAQACLLGLVPSQGATRWVFYATLAAIFLLALLISGAIVFETDEEWLARVVGVLGILDGCGSLMVPVLYKLGGKPVEIAGSESFDAIELACPRCGHRDRYAVGSIQCGQCSLQMSVHIEPPREK